ncbi:MAG: alpha-ketoglutarate-dependent dioxygenase AlkB [Alphaproteobacteria bacterium]|nr:alpha-ketoglutarate-dependent dioxygenase AlkB [Alphaproteobacteria bacterium]
MATLQPGVVLWPGLLDAAAQAALVAEIFVLLKDAPLYRPTMPRSGKPFSVEESSFGPLGWVSDVKGYRYAPVHPFTGKPWPAIPQMLMDLWDAQTRYPAPPECCLVNHYSEDAKMGLHQDRDEADFDAPVLSVSLGDDAFFRIGGEARGGNTARVKLASGDVLMFGGPARLAFHGIDRIVPGTSRLVPGGGRLNLTLRRVTKKDARPGG